MNNSNHKTTNANSCELDGYSVLGQVMMFERAVECMRKSLAEHTAIISKLKERQYQIADVATRLETLSVIKKQVQSICES